MSKSNGELYVDFLKQVAEAKIDAVAKVINSFRLHELVPFKPPDVRLLPPKEEVLQPAFFTQEIKWRDVELSGCELEEIAKRIVRITVPWCPLEAHAASALLSKETPLLKGATRHPPINAAAVALPDNDAATFMKGKS